MNDSNNIELIYNLYQKQYIDINQITEKELDILSYHRLLGYLYPYVTSFKINKQIKERIKNNYNYRKCLYEIYENEIQNIISCFNEWNIRHIFIKGFSLLDYYDKYVREFNDVDIIINFEDINNVIKILNKCGYQFGHYDSKSMKVNKVSRNREVFKILNTHEIPKMIKEINNVYIKIDINFLFQWKGKENKQIEFEELWQNSIKRKKYNILNNKYNILHLCCHFYNETVNFTFNYSNDYKDPKELKLFRLFDILLLLDKLSSSEIKEIINISLKHHIDNEVKFTLKVISEFFPEKLTNELYDFSINEPNLNNNINIYLTKNGDYNLWPISLYDRAFNFTIKKNAIKKCLFNI